MTSIFNPLCKYFTRMVCLKEDHTHKNPLVCKKHDTPVYKCKLCKTKWISYAYRCDICSNNFCIFHYLFHIQLFNKESITELSLLCTSDHLSIPQKSKLQKSSNKFKKIVMNMRSSKIKLECWQRCKHKESIITQIMESESVSELGTSYYRT